MKKQWQMLHPDEQTVRLLERETGCPPLIARLLAIRGIFTGCQAKRFLTPLLRDLASPLEMTGIPAAVDRIHRALTAREKILVFGDYDADGVTATAVLVSFLRQCGARVVYHIPYRMADGYGLGADFINGRARRIGTNLIITVDCGSSSHEAVRLASQLGIDTIVTDHHPVDRAPEAAVAVINPSGPDGQAGLAHLAGVGVAFYLVVALRAHLREKGFWQSRPEPNLKQLCDLVALGTVADVSPLILDNRTLTAAGLEQINGGFRPGIRALMRTSGAPEASADAQTIAFKLAPRINAAGRMAHARMACELLLTDDRRKANRLAAALGRLNGRRQAMESDLLQSILDRFDRRPKLLDRPVLVVHGNHWHAGVLGIVASRLARQFHRPSIVLATSNGTAKGSARSVEGIDISAALSRCEDLLDRFGGHPLAAGLGLATDRLDDFTSRLEAVVEEMAARRETGPTLSIDAHLPLDGVTPELMEGLERLGPFGQGNPHPLFVDTGIRVKECRTVGESHRRMVLESGQSGNGALPAIQFNVPENLPVADRFEKIAYRPQWNHWNGKKHLQVVIEDVVPEP
ncbi:single-stranded-DNA-specific exonuclease RecJ [uncultured Desulfosarcina sp.]|uniref:single-stranded-DNA-specific exonuclease RecJ n=1 Tax=uncultured Desulfosarcina sp. TaxID=218289 RepID=UPI0029C910EF|nr:single-stranded-DNA-specific exonuclease RecJ [uncultured Desulfosarcina sp.]